MASRTGGRGGGDSGSAPGAPSARLVAAKQIARHAERFPDLIPLAMQTTGLSPRDASLAHAIEDAVVRRWRTLALLLDQVLRDPVQTSAPPVQAVLLSGAAQILLMDRIPVHAAIDESVELAKRASGRGPAGMVNAVLRKIAGMRADAEEQAWQGRRDALPLSDGRSLRLQRELLPVQQMERYAVATSHAPWLLERWGVEYGEAARELALHSLCSPPVILNTRHAAAGLPESLRPHSEPGHHVFEGTRAELVALLESRRDVWVQDPASSRAVARAAHLKPDVVVDYCAGQGTKTRQLAAVFPDARIIATDVDRARFETLQRTYGSRPELKIEVVAPQELRSRFIGKADLVVLDVPCSNTGVLSRRPEAKYRAGPEQLRRLTEIQRRIIEDAAPLLSASPGGHLLYSTCSIEREENAEIVSWAARSRRLGVKHEHLTLPAGLPGDGPERYHDGSYSALLA